MNDVNVLKNNGVDLNSSLEFLGDMEMYDETLGEFLKSINEKVNNLKTYKKLMICLIIQYMHMLLISKK